MTLGGECPMRGLHHTNETKEKIRKTKYKIMDSGLTKVQESYIKRNETLLEGDKDFLKTIGKKSSDTQKRNGKHKGKNNANFNNTPILLFDRIGNIVDTFLYIDLKTLKEKYPVRMIQ
jgi:hypothetical protein